MYTQYTQPSPHRTRTRCTPRACSPRNARVLSPPIYLPIQVGNVTVVRQCRTLGLRPHEAHTWMDPPRGGFAPGEEEEPDNGFDFGPVRDGDPGSLPPVRSISPVVLDARIILHSIRRAAQSASTQLAPS